jgi:DNA replication protein DnaC
MMDFSVTQADDLYELVSERVGKSTIFAANRQASDWYGLFPNPVVSESILDRIVNSAHHLPMDGKSYRPNCRPGGSRKSATS